MPGRSTIDRTLTLTSLCKTRRESHKPLFAVYVDLKAAFDSVDRQVLWQLLLALGLPRKVGRMIEVLYTNTESCVRVASNTSDRIQVRSGVRQGCVLTSDSCNVARDWVLERSTSIAMHGVSVGDENFSDLDYADEVALLTELMEQLQSTLEVFAAEAALIGLVVNWKKTKIQSLREFLPPIGDLDIGGEQVETVTSFTYLGTTTQRLETSEGQTTLNMGLHGRE